MTKDEALEAALTALRYDPNSYGYKEIADIAINACEEALEQPQPRLFLDLSNSNGNHPVEQPAQECKWCKSREVNFDEPADPLCKICGKVLDGNVGYGESVDG